MRRKWMIAVSALFALAVVAALMAMQPERLTAARLEKSLEVQHRLDQEAAGNGSTETIQVAQEQPKPAEPAKPQEPSKGDANVFKVKFECSNGNFVVECHKDWAPIGAARFEELVKGGFYNENRFFRVVPGFVVQFGLSGDPTVSAKWRESTIKDEPVKESNTVGTLTFAKSSLPNSRTTQLFINLVDNKRLDGMGFAPFAKVVEGMEVVKAISAKYGERPDQGLIQMQGNEYLKKQFPEMDYIKTATIVP